MAKGARRSAKTYAPRTAARFVRRGAEAVRARGAVIGKNIGRFAAERIALCEWASIVGLRVPFDFIEQVEYVGPGGEHRVYHDQVYGLAGKSTRTNYFGHSVYAPGMAAYPTEYFQRLGWANVLFGDEFRICGVAFDSEDQ